MKEWTDSDVEVVRQHCADRLTARECSAALGGRYSRNACIGKALRMGLHFGNGTRGGTGKRAAPAPTKEQFGAAVKRAAAKRRALQIKVERPKRNKPRSDLVEPEPIGPKNDIPTSSLACRSIKGDVASGEWQYCGHRAYRDDLGRPYCEYHHQRFFHPASAPRISAFVPRRGAPTR